MSLKELPYSHFKVAVEELNHRYKVCIALGSLMEEISEVGSSAGKNLSKLGSQNFLTGHHQWLPTCSVALESIYKMTTTSSGKQLSGHSSNISQNISKTFPEQVRLGKRRVNALASRIASQTDEYKKARLLHSKNVEKYQRLATDTEAAIRSRTTAHDFESRNSADKEPVVAVQGDNFMNRSLNKMLSKIAPEKKLDDKCKDMVRELDVHERAVIASNKRLVVMRGEVLMEIAKAFSELDELEAQRLNFMKEGLSRFCLAAELIANQQHEVINSVLERTNKLDAIDEAVELMKVIDRPAGQSPMKKAVESSDSEDESSDTAGELATLFSKAEKLGDAMEFFRSLVTRATNSMLEVAEVEAMYSRSAHKVLDRHGYCRNSASQWVYAADYSAIPMLAENTPMKSAPLSAAIGAVGATTLALTSNLRSAEFLSRFESPSTKSGWELVVSCVGNTSDLQMRSSEVAGDEVCQQLELVTQRLEIGRKELIEKLALNTKMVENAKKEVKALALKLAKCRTVLRERRDTVKQVKDILIIDSMDSTDAPTAAAVAAANSSVREELEGVGSPDHASVLGSTLDEAVSSPVPSSLSDTFSRKQGLFRKGGLKQVVGLETQADRVARIEKQVSTLEEEERELVDALAVAEQALANVTGVARTQVLPIFDATREFLSTDLVTIKSAIEVLMSWKSDALSSSRNFNRHVKTAHDSIDIARDLTAFVSAVQTAAEGISKEHVNPSLNSQMANAMTGAPLSLLDVPEVEPFTMYSSELIAAEREVISKMAPASSSLYSISNLAMNYSGNNDAGDGNSPGPSSYFKTRDRKGTEESITSTTTTTTTAADGVAPVEVEAAVPPAVVADSLHPPTPLDSAGLELAKFGLNPQDKVVESYSCALYPKKGMLTHGRMFVTQHYLAFSGWPETRVLLLVRGIKEVNRQNTLMYVPNALSVVMNDDSEYFFGSFIDREQCYALLVSLNDVAKHMAGLPGFDETSENRKLEFGYQTQNNLFGGGNDDSEVADANASASAISSSPGLSRASSGGMRSASPAAAIMAAMGGSTTPPKPTSSTKDTTPARAHNSSDFNTPLQSKLSNPALAGKNVAARAPESPPRAVQPTSEATVSSSSVAAATVTASQTTTTTTSVTNKEGENATTTTTTSSASFAVETKPVLPPWVEVNDGVDQSTLFERSNISVMQEKVFHNISPADMWNSTWADGKGYGGFLLEEGELDITFTEWMPLANPKVPEDVAKLSYSYSRQFTYSHVRTTMLMFGPKNAPTNQTQYLYLPIGSKKLTAAELLSARPTRGVIMTLTYFQGIPMCDVFKVLQYWSFDRHAGEAGRTEMKVGLAIHYMKSSMFKAQIYGGSKEELTVMSLKFLNYSEKLALSRFKALPAGFVLEEQTVQATQPGSGEKVQVRRSSLKKVDSAQDSLIVPAAASASEPQHEDNSSLLSAAISTAAVSVDVSVGATETTTLRSSNLAEKTLSVTAATPKALQAPHGGEFALQMHVDVNYILVILACAVIILLILLYRQSSYNSALVQQINLLSRKIDMSQTSMEISMRQSQNVVQKMEAFINNIQK